MPLYLVRWPTLAASLVRAPDEGELLDILDEAADPGGCTYEVYRGPVWIDFEVPFGVRDRTTSTATELEVAVREEIWPLIEYLSARSELAESWPGSCRASRSPRNLAAPLSFPRSQGQGRAVGSQLASPA